MNLLSGRRRRALTFGSLAAIALGAVFVLTSEDAFAHHAEIEATVDCEGVVHYTATAWNGETEQQRTNANIGIWYRTSDNSTYVQLPDEATHTFSAANGFSFQDTFTLPGPLPAWVQLQAQAQVNWANGAAPGESRETGEIEVPEGCTPDTQLITTTTTTTVAPTTTTTTVAPTTTNTTCPDCTPNTQQLPTSTTTTTVAGTTTSAPPTTAQPTTTTTQVLGSQATVAPTTAPPVATSVATESLPQTGGGDSALVLFGLIVGGAGLALLAGTRLRRQS